MAFDFRHYFLIFLLRAVVSTPSGGFSLGHQRAGGAEVRAG
jgi:hypothetical protein